MPTPFASGYAPINLLNDAIQRQAAMGQQGYLDAQKINEAAISDALNRAVQQKALQQQAAAQQAHYGLQQQQLANDLAYRNQALGLTQDQQAQQAKQWNDQFGLNKQLTEAQTEAMKNPLYGQKDAFGFSIDAEAKNQEADGAASELNRKKKQLDAFHTSETTRIGKQWRQAEDLKALDANYQAALLALKTGVPGAERTRFNPTTGEFEALHIAVPVRGNRPAPGAETGSPGSAQPQFGEPGFDYSGGNGTPFTGIAPTSGSGGAPEIRPDAAAVAPVASVNPFTAFLQRQLYGNSSPVRTNAPPVAVPTGTNQALRLDLNTGRFVPIQ